MSDKFEVVANPDDTALVAVPSPSPTEEEEQEASNLDSLLETETASSYDKTKFTFKYSFGQLLDLCTDKVLYFKKPEPGSSPSVQPAWSANVTKLSRIYKAANLSSESHFRSMFSSFFAKHRDALVAPLFDTDDSDKINDAFFVSKEKFEAPGDAKSVKDAASGPVLYLNPTKPEAAAINLPIGEVYCASVSLCVRLSKHMSSNIELKPVLSLLYFYACLLHSGEFAEGDRALVERNLSDLCDAAEATAPGSGPFAVATSSNDSASNVPSNNPMAFLLNMAQSLGLGVDASDALKGASSIFSKIVSEVSKPSTTSGEMLAPGDIGGLLDRFGSVLQNPDIRRDFMDTSDKFSGAMTNLQKMAPDLAQNLGLGGAAATASSTSTMLEESDDAEPHIPQPEKEE